MILDPGAGLWVFALQSLFQKPCPAPETSPSSTSWWASQIQIRQGINNHPKPALKGVGGQVTHCGKYV